MRKILENNNNNYAVVIVNSKDNKNKVVVAAYATIEEAMDKIDEINKVIDINYAKAYVEPK